MAVGNIEAIHDWMIGNSAEGVEGNFFNKEQIMELLTYTYEDEEPKPWGPNYKYRYNEKYQIGKTYTLTESANYHIFVKDVLLKMKQYSAWKFNSGVMTYAVDHVDEMLEFIDSKNTGNRKGITILTNAYGPGSNNYLVFGFHFLESNPQIVFAHEYEDYGMKYLSTTTSLPLAEGAGQMIVYPSRIDTSDSSNVDPWYIGMNFNTTFQVRASNVGLHYGSFDNFK